MTKIELTDGSPIEEYRKRVRAAAERLAKEGMGCNCELDNWQPEISTGHSHVCRIHTAAIATTTFRNHRE